MFPYLFAETWSEIGPRTLLYMGVGAGVGFLLWLASRFDKPDDEARK